jgi:two-component system, NarL family, response regulator LiaR
MFREGVRALLEREGMEVVGEASDGREAVRVVRERRPDVATLDIGMPVMNGLQAARELSRCAPVTRVLVLTMSGERAYVLEALRAGACGYILKAQAASDLINAIRQIASGAVYLSPDIFKAVIDRLVRPVPAAGPLTGREREVLQMVAEGRTTREIGSALGVTAKTAESHRHRIMRKLDIHATAGLVRYAIRQGLIKV